jgi:predicted O-linked N-acetylglucosamine transferase (SPINDLY family)
MTLQQAFDLAVQHHQAGRLPDAEALYRQILAVEPRHAQSLHLLGVIAHQEGKFDAAVTLIRQAIGFLPTYPAAYNNLGIALHGQGQFDEAIAAFRQAIALQPAYAPALNNLGSSLSDKGQLDEAIACFRQALALQPDYPDALSNLGNALRSKGQMEEAIVACRRALTLRPDHSEAYNHLGNALKVQGQLDQAIATYRQALSIRPSFTQAHCNLGIALKDQGYLDEAVAAFRRALDFQPNYAEAHSNLLYILHFHPGFDARAIAEEHRRWNDSHAESLRQLSRPHANDRDPERRLRVGYVSPDFRDHVVGRNMLPLFAHHAHEHFEVFCYAENVRSDEITGRFRESADHWRSTVGLGDETLAALIREDRIDILVDLALHMAGNRLPLFARKPAPIQVTFAGYPGSTGLSTIDYRLSDPYLDPAGTDESLYAEKTVRLPHSFWCYDPFDCCALPINTLPAQANGYVTFGCLNNFCKINDKVLRLWAGVLRAVAGSRLLMLAPEGSHRQRALELLRQEGIASERVEFFVPRPRRQYLELYQRIDLGLDTLPYNGHTTSLDSFWMGVPVVTLVGETVVGRAGLCQLMNLGLPELVAHTGEDYVRIAAELAGDLPRLAELRATLRARMQASPLMDAPAFARDIEAAYRTMWRTWCEQPQSPSCPK